jgi:hypothetical protein
MASRKSQIGAPLDSVKGGRNKNGTVYHGPSKRTKKRRAARRGARA